MTGRRLSLLPAVVVLAAFPVAGCSLLPVPQPPARAQPVPGVPVDPIEEQLAAWRANGPASYTWQVEFSCECGLSGKKEITVVDGKVTRVQTPAGDVPLDQLAGTPLTVDAVLELALAASKQGGAVGGTWPGTNGVPSELNIDPKQDTLDDELGLRVIRLDPSP